MEWITERSDKRMTLDTFKHEVDEVEVTLIVERMESGGWEPELSVRYDAQRGDWITKRAAREGEAQDKGEYKETLKESLETRVVDRDFRTEILHGLAELLVRSQ